MAASAKKKNKKGKTFTLTDFLAEDGGGNNNNPAPPPSYPAKSTSWADETDDLDGDVSTSWHTNEDGPSIDRSILPTAPRSAREPNVDRSRLPRSPPYTAFLGNLPYDVSEESIKDFFRGLAISAVRLPREPSNPERLKGFGYAEFDDVDSLLRALSLNEENLGNRRIRVDIADQSNDKERDNGGMSRSRGGDMADLGPDKTDTDWRARPSSPDEPPKKDDAFGGDKSRDRYESGPRRDNAFGGGQDRDRFRDRYDGDRRDFGGGDRQGGGAFGSRSDSGGSSAFGSRSDSGGSSAFGSRSDSGGSSAFGSRSDRDGGRRAFGTGFSRDNDSYRSSSDRYGGESDRYGGGARTDRYERREETPREDRGEGSTQRAKLVLKPRAAAEGGGGGGGGGAAPPASSGGGRSSIFGAAKPVDTASKEREMEERLKKEQERLEKQLEEGRGMDRNPRDRDRDTGGWRTEETHTERSRTGSESSQPGSTSGRVSRRRESERSVENEVFSGKEDEPSSPGATSPRPPSTTSSSKEQLKVVPAPPPKENAWAKRSAVSTSSGEADVRLPVSPSSTAPPDLSSSDTEERGSEKDENKADGWRRDRGPLRGRGGPAGPGAGRGRGEGANKDRRREADRKDNGRERDSRPPPEPKKYEESPTPKFSSASKYAALLMDGDQGDDGEDVE